MRLVLILAALLLTITAQAASIYKWTDARGRVHYSDTPPPRGAYQAIGSDRPVPQSDAPNSYERAQTIHKELEKRAQKQRQQAARRAQAAKAARARAKNCRIARHRIRQLTTHRNLLIPPEDGEGRPTRITEPQRREMLAAARKARDKYCR